MSAKKHIIHIINFFIMGAEDGHLLTGEARRPGWQVAWDNEGNGEILSLNLRAQGSKHGTYGPQAAGKHALCVRGRLLRRG